MNTDKLYDLQICQKFTFAISIDHMMILHSLIQCHEVYAVVQGKKA